MPKLRKGTSGKKRTTPRYMAGGARTGGGSTRRPALKPKPSTAPRRTASARRTAAIRPIATGTVGADKRKQAFVTKMASGTLGAQRTQYGMQAGSGGGGGGYDGYEIPAASASGDELADLHDIEFDEYEVDLQGAQGGNPPSWWKPFKPKNRKDMERPDVAYLAMLNAAIPYMSPEDQRNAAAQLYTAHGNAFAIYKQSTINESEAHKKTITSEQALMSDAYKNDPDKFNVINKDYYTSKSRATGMIDALNQLRLGIGNEGETGTGFPRKHIGGTGQGYSWLQQMAGALENWGTEGGDDRMSNADYMGFLGAIDPLMSLGQGEAIGPVSAIGQMFAKPFFSAGALRPTYQTETGQTMMGRRNKLLF